MESRGIQETIARLKRAADEVGGEPVAKKVMQASLLVLRDAKLLAPVDTGQLKNSLTAKVESRDNRITGVVGSNVTQAAPMETGTRPHWPPMDALRVWAKRHGLNVFLVARAIARKGTKPRRYLQGAFDRNKEEVRKLVYDAVQGIVNRANGKT